MPWINWYKTWYSARKHGRKLYNKQRDISKTEELWRLKRHRGLARAAIDSVHPWGKGSGPAARRWTRDIKAKLGMKVVFSSWCPLAYNVNSRRKGLKGPQMTQSTPDWGTECRYSLVAAGTESEALLGMSIMQGYWPLIKNRVLRLFGLGGRILLVY